MALVAHVVTGVAVVGVGVAVVGSGVAVAVGASVSASH